MVAPSVGRHCYPGERFAVDSHADRCLHSWRARRRRTEPVARGRPANADSPVDVRSARPASHARGDRRLRDRHERRRLRTTGRSAAGFAPLWRAVGPAIGWTSSTIGETHGYDKDKPRPNAWPYRDYVIARLQRRQALRPVRRRAVGRRRAVSATIRRPRSPPASSPPARGISSATSSCAKGRSTRRSRARNDRDDMVATRHVDVPEPDGPLRPVPQPQVRSDSPARLLLLAGGLRRHRSGRSDLRSRPASAARTCRVDRQESRAGRPPQKRSTSGCAGIASPELAALDAEDRRALRGAETAAHDRAERRPAAITARSSSPRATSTKWVQVDLGQTATIDEVDCSCRPTSFTAGIRGPASAFRRDFGSESPTTADFATRAAWPITPAAICQPGDRRCAFRRRSAARYVRVTATRLWKRTDDFDLRAWPSWSSLSGRTQHRRWRDRHCARLDRGQTALGMKNLVDGSAARALQFDVRILPRRQQLGDRDRPASRLSSEHGSIAALARRRDAAAECSNVADHLRRDDRQIAALPPQQMVYAAAQPVRSARIVRRAEAAPVHLLRAAMSRSPKELCRPAVLVCVRGRSPLSHSTIPTTKAQRRRRARPMAGRSARTCWCGGRSSIASGNIISVRESSTRPTISAAWARCRAIPNCSIGWPAGSWSMASRSSRSTG